MPITLRPITNALTSATSTFSPTINISNIIARSQICSPFDLTPLQNATPFDKSKSPLSRIPIRIGRTKFSIFKSGSIVSRASKSLLELEENLLRLHEHLVKYGLELDLEYTVINIVAFSKLQLPNFNLLALANQLPASSYDPTASTSEHDRPGCNVVVLALTKKKPRKTILIFSSSAITLTGFRSVPDIRNQARQLRELLAHIISEHPEVKSE